MIFFICLAVLCILYGVLVARPGSGTLFFACWIVLGCLFLVIGVTGFPFRIWPKLPRLLRYILISGMGGCGLLFLVVEGCILSRFHSQSRQPLNYLIVLGAQVRENGPSIVLRQRLDQAVEYLKENLGTQCIVSGGKGKNEPFSEAEGMKNYLLEKGISKSRILMEDQSENTTQNIEYCRRLVDLEGKKVGIVTNNFHLFRALHIAKKQGLTKVEGIAAASSLFFLPNNMVREFFGVIKDW